MEVPGACKDQSRCSLEAPGTSIEGLGGSRWEGTIKVGGLHAYIYKFIF